MRNIKTLLKSFEAIFICYEKLFYFKNSSYFETDFGIQQNFSYKKDQKTFIKLDKFSCFDDNLLN